MEPVKILNKIEDAIGQPLQKITSDGENMALFFPHGALVVEPHCVDPMVDTCYLGDRDLQVLGLISKEEYELRRAQRVAAQEGAFLKARRAKYVQLKKEFEPEA